MVRKSKYLGIHFWFLLPKDGQAFLEKSIVLNNTYLFLTDISTIGLVAFQLSMENNYENYNTTYVHGILLFTSLQPNYIQLTSSAVKKAWKIVLKNLDPSTRTTTYLESLKFLIEF